jgi:hypothetical protein
MGACCATMVSRRGVNGCIGGPPVRDFSYRADAPIEGYFFKYARVLRQSSVMPPEPRGAVLAAVVSN